MRFVFKRKETGKTSRTYSNTFPTFMERATMVFVYYLFVHACKSALRVSHTVMQLGNDGRISRTRCRVTGATRVTFKTTITSHLRLVPLITMYAEDITIARRPDTKHRFLGVLSFFSFSFYRTSNKHLAYKNSNVNIQAIQSAIKYALFIVKISILRSTYT